LHAKTFVSISGTDAGLAVRASSLRRSVVADLSIQPFAQQRIHGFLPSLKLSGRGKTIREVPLDMAPQNDGAKGKHERVVGGLVGEMVLHQTNGYPRGSGHRAE